MNALISSSIPENTNLPKRSGGASREDGDASGFDLILKGGADRKTAGASDREKGGGEALDALEAETTSGDEAATGEIVQLDQSRSRSGPGRLGFERSLLQARHEPRQSSPSDGVALPLQASARAQAAIEAAHGGPVGKGEGAKATIEQLLGGYGAKPEAGSQGAQLQAGSALDGKTASASAALAFPSSDTAAAVSLAAGRVVRGGESAKGLSARADLVSMRTDFQPVGMGANGAQTAGGATIPAAQKLEAALRSGSAAETGDMASAANGMDPLSDMKQAKAQQHLMEAARLSTDRPIEAKGSASIEKAIDGDGDFGKQIGSIIADNMPQTGNRQGPAAQAAAPAHAAFAGSSERVRYQAGGAAMKTLQIQLQPAHFGKLDVLMKVVNGQMALELSVTEPETLMRLQDDREGLKAAMASAGFDLDEAQVTITLRETGAQGARATSANGDPAAQARAEGHAASGGETGQSRGQEGGQRGERSPSGPMREEQTGAMGHAPALERGRRSGSDYYL